MTYRTKVYKRLQLVGPFRNAPLEIDATLSEL